MTAPFAALLLAAELLNTTASRTAPALCAPETSDSDDDASATPTSRRRSATFALRIALENAVAAALAAHHAPRALDRSRRAAFLWLHSCAGTETALRAKAVWNQLSQGCHHHQYELGPTADQVRRWHREVSELINALTSDPAAAPR